MVGRTCFLSLLAIAAAALGIVAAIPSPQSDDSGKPLSKGELKLDTLASDGQPLQCGDSSALLRVAPELGRLTTENRLPRSRVAKPDAGKSEKHATCNKAVNYKVWEKESKSMCDCYFRNAQSAYYLKEGGCISGRSFIAGFKYVLHFRCCAKGCGAKHATFVAVTNHVCQAGFINAARYGREQCGDKIGSSDNERDGSHPMFCSFWTVDGK